ncbi:hypothetical protein ACLD72_014095 [Paenibacillus sp. TH7-28]
MNHSVLSPARAKIWRAAAFTFLLQQNEPHYVIQDEPGTYEVYGIAEFTAKKDGAAKDYSIETEHKQIEVSG